MCSLLVNAALKQVNRNSWSTFWTWSSLNPWMSRLQQHSYSSRSLLSWQQIEILMNVGWASLMQLWRGKTAELFFVLMKQLWNGFTFSRAAVLRNVFIFIHHWGVSTSGCVCVLYVKLLYCFIFLCHHWFRLVWCLHTIFQFKISLRTAFPFLLMPTWRFLHLHQRSVWTKQSPAIFLPPRTLRPKRQRYPQRAPEYSAQVSYTLKKL